MEKDFDFKELGKRMPYKVPAAYFEKAEQKIIARTCPKKPGKHRLWIYIPTLAAVAMLVGVLFIPTYWQGQEEQTAVYEVTAPSLEELSDEELEEIVGLSSIDVFLY